MALDKSAGPVELPVETGQGLLDMSHIFNEMLWELFFQRFPQPQPVTITATASSGEFRQRRRCRRNVGYGYRFGLTASILAEARAPSKLFPGNQLAIMPALPSASSMRTS